MFTYVVNPSADEPIMLMDKHIGNDDHEGMGIDGSLFVRELMMLDQMGKKSIKVWINSPGGIVMDGYNIYNAILKTKTKVDTVCVGIAASIAAVIFQAGRKRVMNEYALLMYHNPYGGSSDELKKMRVSIAKMIAGRTSKSDEDVLKIMDKTTWITASEAFASGFCDEIEVSAEFNKRYKTSDAKAMWRESGTILNSIFKQKNTKMNKVANKLGLNPEASEDSILAEISRVVNSANEMADKFKKAEKDYAEAKAKCDELENALNEMKKKAEEDEKAKNLAELEAKKVKAKNLIEGFVKAGKIKNESSEKWIALAESDFDGIKNMLEELPTNRQSVKMPVVNQGSGDLENVIARKMADVRNHLKIN